MTAPGNAYPAVLLDAQGREQSDPKGSIQFTNHAEQPGTGGGGSQPGAAIVRGPFAFAFDTPNLNAGVPFYTSTPDDVILDVWVEITTAFDGTTPLVDVGVIAAGFGLFSNAAGASVDASLADDLGNGAFLHQNGGASHTSDLLTSIFSTPSPQRVAPGRFDSAVTLAVWASQDGIPGGTAVGGTAGAGRVYIVTASPAPFS